MKIAFAVVAMSVPLAADFAAAAVVVTVVPTSPVVLSVGETATLAVLAQSTSGSGIFGWDVNLRIADPAIVDLVDGTLDRSGWTGNPATSSDGTLVADGIDAIYDTADVDMTKGLGAPVQLFSIDVRGLAEGVTTLAIEPDATTGTDFLTWASEVGADYTQASVTLTVVPEPSSALLAAAAAWLLACARCRVLRRAGHPNASTGGRHA